MIVTSGFKSIEVERLDCESYQNYLERTYFIMNNLKSGKYDIDELIQKSLIYYSIKVLGCGYVKDTENCIRDMSKFAGVRLEK